jgi:hypothetical protein
LKHFGYINRRFSRTGSEASQLGQQLFGAIYNRNTISAERLLREGANIEAKGQNGETPLIIAAEKAVHTQRPTR